MKSIRSTIRPHLCALLLLAALAHPASARQSSGPPPASPALAEAQAALRECAALAESNPQGAARRAAQSAGEHAERLFRAVVRAEPANVEARVGLAQTLSRCRIPFANMIRIISLSNEAVELLEAALQEAPTNWEARFTLAMNYFHQPAFLGKTGAAITHFERLLEQQGARNDVPAFALTYFHLGELYRRSGRTAEARALWQRGAALFPAHAGLAERAARADEEVPDAAPAPPAPLASGAEAAAGAQRAPSLPAVVALTPLRVEAGNHQLEGARTGTALRRLDVVTLPGGRGDMLEALQSVPGATRAGEGSELYVRGGDAAETAVLFDGGRFPYPGRWETLSGSVSGAVDAMVLRRAFFSSGGFSARYGNALSGVVDVETEGRPLQRSFRAGVNMVQLGGSARTPLGPRAGVWATAAAADVSLLARMNGEGASYERAPRSLQAIVGAAYEPRAGVELRAVGLSLRDEFSRQVQRNGYDGAFASTGETHHVALSGRALRADGSAGVLASLTGSLRRSAFSFGVLDRARTDRALGGRMEGDWVAAPGLRVRAGAEALLLDATVDGRVPTTPVLTPGAPFALVPTETTDASHAGGYLEVERTPLPGLALVAGLRADRLPGSANVTVDPRVAAAYTSHGWTGRLGAGVFHQGPWRAGYRLPNPDVPGGVPTRARHAVLGLERSAGGDPALRVEAYRKWYDDYVVAGEGPQTVAAEASGVDAIARWSNRDGLNGWISYSLLRGEVELEDGRRVRSAVDVTHSLTLVGRQPVGENWEVGATARYGTGRPYTPVIGTSLTASPDAPPQPLYGATHGARLPYYARLDGRITRYVLAPQGTAVLYLEMLNLLGRRNVTGYSHDSATGERLPVESFFATRSFVAGVEVQFR